MKQTSRSEKKEGKKCQSRDSMEKTVMELIVPLQSMEEHIGADMEH